MLHLSGRLLGSIVLSLAILLFGLLVRDVVPVAHATVSFTVNSTADSVDAIPGDGFCDDGAGNCTLRAAIMEANANADDNNIFFSIGGGGVLKTIKPATALPVLSESAFVNGSSQIAPATLPGIEIDGSMCTGCAWGLAASGTSVRMTGFVINRFPAGTGVALGGPGGTNRITNSYIGTDTTGAVLQPNAVGVLIAASSFNDVDNSTISGNSVYGVWITSCFPPPFSGCADTTYNDVFNNKIGTNVAGTVPRANGIGVQVDGPDLLSSVAHNTIGDGNVISGNTGNGVTVTGNATLNAVRGNLIGTDPGITAAIANGGAGVCMCGASGNDIGPYTTISGNAGPGVLIQGASNTRMGLANVGNNGSIAIPNGGAGIEIDGSATTATGNVIGCVPPGCGMAVAGNTGNGVYIHGANASGNTLESMSVGDYCNPNCLPPNDVSIPNGSHGILVADGAHDNMFGPDITHGIDVAFNHGAGIALDGGPGNFVWIATTHENDGLGIDVTPIGSVTPQIDGAFESALYCPCNGGQLTLAGYSHGLTPLTTYPNIGVFLNASCDPSGYGENQFGITGGSWYVPLNAVTTDAGGNLSGAGSVTGVPNSLGQYITNFVVFPSDHSTTELSPCLRVESDADGDGIQDEIDPQPATASDAFSDVPLGGTTFGTIVDRGSGGTCYVSVADLSNPDGVVLANVCRTGGGPAHVLMCGSFTVEIPDGASVRETCGSLHNAVEIGPIDVTFGTPPYVAVLPSETRVTLNDVGAGRFTVVNDPLSAASVSVSPPSTSVSPGANTTMSYGDADADGCSDVKEPLLNPPTNPANPWDFYSVPVPALIAAPAPTTTFGDNIVGPGDAQAVFAYFKLGAAAGNAIYEQDLNQNLIKDGREYDRSVAGPGQSGPPDGIVAPTDAQLAFAQFKKGYSC